MTTNAHCSAGAHGQTPEWLLPDPRGEEQKARLWAMTPDERVRAMPAGELSMRLCSSSAAASSPRLAPGGGLPLLVPTDPLASELAFSAWLLRCSSGSSHPPSRVWITVARQPPPPHLSIDQPPAHLGAGQVKSSSEPAETGAAASPRTACNCVLLSTSSLLNTLARW